MNRYALAAAALVVALALPGAALAHPAAEHAASDGAARAKAMGDAAARFVATLDPAQRAKLLRPIDDNAARTDWSNLPSSVYPRTALALGDLSDAQRVAFHDLMAAAMSGEGYGEAATIIWIDDILRGIETERLSSITDTEERRMRAERVMQSRSSGNYWISLFGDPGSPRWGWMINGHHFAANFTVVDGRIGFTPLFLGANPQTIQQGPYAGWRVLDLEIAGGFAMIAALDADQRKAALVSETIDPAQFTGKGRKDNPPAEAGIAASRLTPAQRERLMALVDEFVGFANRETAAAQMAAIRADDPATIHFAWWGSPDDRAKRFMYRISGPSIRIEYIREPRADGSPDNHVHAIVRDPRNDYGEDWLARHYTEAPHP
jgi:Protein of unknown function (DUF3500)